MVGRHRRLASQPGEDVVIGNFHELLEAAKIGIVQCLDRRIRKTTHQQVHFANAAMPSTKTQPPQANLGIGKHEFLVQWQALRGASGRFGRSYIAMAETRVIVTRKPSWTAPG